MNKEKELSISDIKQDIFQKFRSLEAKAGDTLSKNWLKGKYFPGLNQKERAQFNSALNELIEEGLVEKIHYIFHMTQYLHNLRLTARGEEIIYSSRK